MRVVIQRVTQAGLAVLALGLAAILITACKPARQEPPPEPETNRAKKFDLAAVPKADTVMLDPLPAAMAVNTTTNPADRAWLELTGLLQMPEPPETWMEKEPSPQEIEVFRKKVAEQVGAATAKAREFYTKFPDDKRSAEARQQEFELLNSAIELGDTNRVAELQKLEAARLKDTSMSEDDRLELRFRQVQRLINGGQFTNRTAALPELDRQARALQKEFPKREEVLALLMTVAEGWLESNQAEKARPLAQAVVDAATDSEHTDAAKGLLKKLDLVGKPPAIQFTAIDGRAVDLAKLKGKVVLVDFWATWCRPCMVELPNLKAAYEKLQPKGFEIVGLSLDRNQADLERIVKRESIPWPQHFDADPEGNKFAREFGVVAIPTLWLIDKKGLLRDLDGRTDLVSKVDKLLAEP